MNRKIRYLKVLYHDNDFQGSIDKALKRLWKYISHNNKNEMEPKPLPELFQAYHKKGILFELINYLILSECIASDVEHQTRGLALERRHDLDSFEHHISTPAYLGCKIEFRKQHTMHRFNNGEVSWLELETGEIHSSLEYSLKGTGEEEI